MDGAAAVVAEEKSQVLLGDAKTAQLKERLERLLQETAEVEVELSRAEGTIGGLPHYSVIEGRAHALGRRLSQEAQRRQMREVSASQPLTAKCPGCGTRCELHPFSRVVNSVDGSVELQELVGDCPCCRRSFFPAAGDVGI
jgi:DNA repair exonuclease SbcCD ATPase subunit